MGSSPIAACENEARARGFKLVMIGVSAGNVRAEAIYRAAGFSPYSLTLRKYL